jgi:hypothetical protein
VCEDDATRTGDTGEYEVGACQVVHDERMLDGNARLNLATVVATCVAGS